MDLMDLERLAETQPSHEVTITRSDAEAVLRIHCRNNFRKALTGLIDLASCVSHPELVPWNKRQIKEWSSKLINELQTLDYSPPKACIRLKEEDSGNKTIKCLVAATNANGEPDLYFVKVSCTASEYENGDHYNLANKSAEDEGYAPALAYDEFDSAGRAMLGLFVWDSAPVIYSPSVEKEKHCNVGFSTPDRRTT